MNLLLFAGIGRDIQWASFGIAVGIMAGVALLMALCIILISVFAPLRKIPVSRKSNSVWQAQTAALADIPAARALPKLLSKAKQRLTPADKPTRKRR